VAASLVRSGVHANPSWIATTSYPGGSFYAGSCVASDSTIYCIGGTNTDQVWYAPLDSAAVGQWKQAAPYGEGGANHALSCGIDGGYIYCVGGVNQQGATDDVTGDAWFAPLASSGVGAWRATSNYDAPVWGHSCVAWNGYMYCVGGLERTYPSSRGDSNAHPEPFDTPTGSVRYAPVSSAGVGPWQATSNYGTPIWGHSCVVANGYIYCVGGSTGDASTSDVRYAQIQSHGGLSSWVSTTSYGGGAVEGLSCAAVGQQIYCVGGATPEMWSAPLSPFGVGAWARQQDYPAGSWNPGCVSDTSAIYCVGGNANRTSGETSPAAVNVYATRPAQDALEPSQVQDDARRAATVDDSREPAPAKDARAVERSLGAAGAAALVPDTNTNQMPPFVGVPGVLSHDTGEECASVPSEIIGSGRAKCHATAGTVALDPPSAAYRSTVTVSVVVTDTSDSPAQLANAVAFGDNGAGGTFSTGVCRTDRDTLACSTTYSTPDAGKQVTITATHQDPLHTRCLANAVLTLTGSNPTINVTSSANPAVVGEAVHFNASISPVNGASGKVAFEVDGVAFPGPNSQVASDSRATSGTTSTLTVGIHVVTAAFSGGVSLDDKAGVIAPGVGTMALQVIGELKDQSSCQTLGGSWTALSATCTVSSLIVVDDTNSFQIDRGVTLANTNGSVAIDRGGIIVNRGRMTNSGRQDASRPSTIAVASGGRLVNVGSLSNQAIVSIDPDATLTNRGTIDNECAGTTPGGGIVSGAVSGALPVNRCDAAGAERRP